MTLAAKLAAFTTTACPTDEARAVMRQSLYDWMACGIAGVDEPVAAIMRAQALGDGGTGAARLFGGGDVPARAAALANGTISHALDYDDTHFDHIGHPSSAVFPAVFAIGGNGEDTLEAALIGAEVAVRVGLWLGRSHYQAGFHQTATSGAFGATAAAARMRGLSVDETAQALAITATKAAGLKSQFGTMGKPLNAGLAAECGVVATDLAQRGFTSNLDALDGPQGFGPTHHGAADTSAFDDLGNTWHMTRVSHKLHACCHGLHAAVEALGSLSVTADQVETIHIRTHPRWNTVCNIAEPETGLEAKFSYRHVAAMVVAGRDTTRVDGYTDAGATDASLVSLRQNVDVTLDETIAETATLVSVTLQDGTIKTASHDLSLPMSMDDKWAKLRVKGAGLVGGLEPQLYNATARRVNADALLDLMG